MKKKAKVVFIPTGEILPNPNQPRSCFDDASLAMLAESIRRFGVIQPLTVKKRENVPRININGQTVTAPGFEIIAGERRWRAARMIGLSELPCMIVDCTKEKSSYIAFAENVFREDLSFFDVAYALQDMLAMTGCTQTELAEKLSLSQPSIANKLRLLRLTPEERETILKSKLTEKHARALIRVDDQNARSRFINDTVRLSLSSSELEKRISAYLAGSDGKKKKAPSAETKPTGFRGKRIGVISDIGCFFNSINNAVKMVRDVGVNVERKEIDTGDAIEIVITVPKKKSCSV